MSLCSNANDTARGPSARIASRLALLMSTFTQIVRARVDHDRAAENALRPDQLDQRVLNAAFAVALGVSLEVAEVADMAVAVGGGTVLLGGRVY